MFFARVIITILLSLPIIALGLYLTNKRVAEEAREKARVEQVKKDMKAYATYIGFQRRGDKFFSDVLEIKKRGAIFADAIKIYDDNDVIVNYVPDQYVYTSVTLGGATTGWVDKKQGYSYVEGKESNGKCKMEYFDLHTIEKIQLTDELYEKAKKSKIAKYLNEDKQIVVDTGASGTLSRAYNTVDWNTPVGSLFLQRLAKEGYPTRQKCIEILDWLCEVEEEK